MRILQNDHHRDVTVGEPGKFDPRYERPLQTGPPRAQWYAVPIRPARMPKRGGPAMMSADQLRRYARSIRDETMDVDARLLTMIESDVAAYRGYLREPRSQLPPPELAELLPLM